MVLISFKDLYEIHIFPKFHRCGSKIVPATPFWNLKFKWAWQAHFLSHNLLSLQNCLFFTNKEMMLMSFFEINDGIWDKNFVHRCHIHILIHPCLISYHVEPNGYIFFATGVSLLSSVDIQRNTYLPPFVNIVFGCSILRFAVS